VNVAMSKTAEQWAKVMETHSGYPLQWGPTNVDRYIGDPKRIAFMMARYKFSGKMLKRCETLLDVGCGDGMGTIGFLNDTEAKEIVGIDFEPKSIGYANDHLMPALHALRAADASRISFRNAEFMSCEFGLRYHGLACLDVIEHIEPEMADKFIGRLHDVLTLYGVAVVGTPSLAGEAFASVHSKVGHINLDDPDRLRAALERKFRRVFMFSMNDELVHTGFDKLAHYLMAVAVK
jgi:2-polyprenyl-3-methyl-5-hydroxy-6-metoxy-1,4-benzoquinol methylase